MRTSTSPQYLQIAQDIAARIAHGELREGSQLHGRSVMASEYNVSPETIRKALHLLADMKVVEIRPQSGVIVLSVDSARRYIDNFAETVDVQSLRIQLKKMLTEVAELYSKISDTVSELAQTREAYTTACEPLPNYEVVIPNDSPVVGISIGALNFWQNTGATIAAVRRGQNVIISPGPYAELYGDDVLILVGTTSAIGAARNYVAAKE